VDSFNTKGKLDSIRARFKSTPFFFIALHDIRVVGMIRGRRNRIVNLFVEGAYHRKGIATQLTRRFEAACRAAGESEIVVRSSLYAVPFYASLGYKKTTGVRNLHGLQVQPMKKKLEA
jgi:GNAT superfamily N-acetyltransferase